MNVNNICSILKSFEHSLKGSFHELDFKIVDFVNMDLFKESYKQPVPSAGYEKKSGVYFISNTDGSILYIGKAGANNLAAEIWSKFGAPVLDENGKPNFIRSNMAKYAPTNELSDLITRGDFFVSAAVIEPRELVSLLEVLLHTICVTKEESLPPLNRRIG